MGAISIKSSTAAAPGFRRMFSDHVDSCLIFHEIRASHISMPKQSDSVRSCCSLKICQCVCVCVSNVCTCWHREEKNYRQLSTSQKTSRIMSGPSSITLCSGTKNRIFPSKYRFQCLHLCRVSLTLLSVFCDFSYEFQHLSHY